ncbi:MAG: VCBS repeat-containing protein, partial [Nitrospirae bacterium]
VNGDGKADLIWRKPATGNTVIWFLDGATLASAAHFGITDPAWEIRAVADMNNDGRSDVLLHNINDDSLQIWFGTPTGLDEKRIVSNP